MAIYHCGVIDNNDNVVFMCGPSASEARRDMRAKGPFRAEWDEAYDFLWAAEKEKGWDRTRMFEWLDVAVCHVCYRSPAVQLAVLAEVEL